MGLIPTFAEFCRMSSIPNLPVEHQRVDLLWAMYDQHVWSLVNQLRADPDRPGTDGALVDVLAESVIVDHLGERWYEQNVVRSGSSGLSSNYLNFDGGRVHRLLSFHRTHELARRLYQLQSFDWFPHVLAKIASDTLSGATFELDILWLLQIASGPVSATVEGGRKGGDFDLSTYFRGQRIPVEVKTKDDATPWRFETVVNTVKSAAKQLPKGSKGVLFIRIPPSWVRASLEEHYLDALAEGSRQTSRIAAVVTAVDKPHFTDQSERFGTVSRHFNYFQHPDCPEPIWEMCLTLKTLWDADATQMAPRPPF